MGCCWCFWVCWWCLRILGLILVVLTINFGCVVMFDFDFVFLLCGRVCIWVWGA